MENREHLSKLTLNRSKMKKGLILYMLWAMAFNSMAQSTTTKTAKSEIAEVKVYPRGAQIVRKAQLRLPAGESKWLFQGLPSSIDGNSVQIKGTGDFTLMGVNYSLNYLSKSPRSVSLDSLQSLLKKAQYDLNTSLAQSEILVEELSLLNANKDLGGPNGTDINSLKIAMQYYRTELVRIKNSQLTEKDKQDAFRIQINDLQRQLNVINNQRDQPSGEVEITVRAPRTVDVRLSLSYFTYNAGWTPSYDVRVVSVKESIKLVYKASVYQSTGENWDQVKLSFSSATPTQGGTAPSIQPWYLRPIEPEPISRVRSYAKSEAQAPMAARAMADDIDEMMEEEKIMVSEVRQNQTSVDFIVPVPYSVKSNGKSTLIDLNEYEVPAIFEYFAVPKLDKDAFLLARVYDWDQYSLLPGPMNLYFEEGYVGKSMLNPGVSDDTLNLSLGRDKSIVIERTKVADFSKRKAIGMNVVESRGYEIEIRNTKKQDIQITFYDQLPISGSSEIEVRTLKVGDADFNAATGVLKWNEKIPTQSSQKWSFQFEVRYPKKLKIQLD